MAKTPAPRLIDSTALMQAVANALRMGGKTIGFVPTMGALHPGHLALIREARQRADVVVVSVFVNPKQFDKPADLSAYPRTLETDLAKCRTEGVDVIFAPRAHAMYPAGFDTSVTSTALARRWEGRSRKGHFDGVCTVCLKLFNLVRPHFAVFGEKDYQQLQIIRRMVRDLSLPLEIVPFPVVRDTDGLALSSRNERLTNTARARATCLYRALVAAQDRVQEGVTSSRSIESSARAVLMETSGFARDYCAVVDPNTLERVTEVRDVSRLLIAGSFGTGRRQVRLLDNGPLFPGVERA
jgi:pantoate--beta-alanine ligase